MQQTKY